MKVRDTEAALTAGGDVTAEMATASFGLMLKPSTARDRGVTVEDGVGTVQLSMSGSGAVTYQVVDGTTGADDKDEWVKLPVTFEWESGDVIDSGEVAVSFAPVSTMGGDTFASDGAPAERYVASGSHTVIDVSPCLTTLLFPYVLHHTGFDTGISHFEHFLGIRLLRHQLPRCRGSRPSRVPVDRGGWAVDLHFVEHR